METLLQDVRYGLRMLAKNAGFTAVALLTLALGMGANTAIFSVINGFFLHPPGIPHPERLVAPRVTYEKLGLKNITVSAPDFAQIRDSKQVFAAAALENDTDFNYTAGNFPERLPGAQVSAQWFEVFEAKPMLGRVFTPEEDQPNANREVVLAYGAWQRWFGGDQQVIGRTMQLNQQPYKIVGVMGPEFHWPARCELWSPLGLAPDDFAAKNTFNENYLAVARLQPGVSFSQANTYAALLGKRLTDPRKQAADYARDSGWGLVLMPLAELVYGDLRTPVLILAGAVAFVLLIACANIAGLLLAKAAGRSQELAVRAVLGASRGRLVRQVLVESALLALGGILVGLAAARAGLGALMLAAPEGMAAGARFSLDGHVLLFTAAMGIVAVLIFGCVPAWHMSQANSYNALRESGRTAGGSRGRQQFRGLLVAGELALALVLLAGTGLLLKSLGRIGQVNPGFQPQGVMTAQLSLPNEQYKTPEKQIAFFRGVVERLSQTPGVTAAGAGLGLPFAGGNPSASFIIEGQPIAAGDPGPHGDVRLVTPGYFTALGIPLARGRLFTDDDRLGAELVAVIDENLAHDYWPHQDPLGQKIGFDPKGPWATIVGIVRHVRFNQLAGEESSASGSQSAGKGVYYYPAYQIPGPYLQSASLVAKTTGDPAPLAGYMREAVHAADSNQPVHDMKTMDALIADSLGPQRFAANLLAVFAGLAMALAAVGLYGLISYSVAQRSNEIGIRMALGAEPANILRMVLRQGTRLAMAGVAAGIVAGLLLTRAMQSLLYGVSAADPLSFFGAALLLVLVALLACYVPARRATRVDPIVALRYE